jgi:RNA polymerase sigma factor (sigma-70 family)
MPPAGLEAVFLANRDRLLRFLAARGAGDAAEDLLHELWLKVSAARTGPVAAPLPYLFRAADTLMIDRYRSRRQAEQRDRDWSDAEGTAVPGISEEPSSDRVLIARQTAARVAEALEALGPRVATAFRRHRVDGLGQREIAGELGVSLSTVEGDLRRAYRALAALREQLDEV